MVKDDVEFDIIPMENNEQKLTKQIRSLVTKFIFRIKTKISETLYMPIIEHLLPANVMLRMSVAHSFTCFMSAIFF